APTRRAGIALSAPRSTGAPRDACHEARRRPAGRSLPAGHCSAVLNFSSCDPGSSLGWRTLSASGRVVLGYGVPVDDVPEGLDVVGAAVLVLEVVGMLPHVEPEDRRVTVHQRAVLVGSRVEL